MPSYDHAQVSFAGGEISPRLFGHVEDELYKKGLAYCENWEPLGHGSARLRGGTKRVASLAGVTAARLLPLRFSGSQDYTVVLTDSLLRIYDDSGPLTGTSVAELVTNGTFYASPPSTGWTGTATFNTGYVRIQGLTGYARQLISVPALTTSISVKVNIGSLKNLGIPGEPNPTALSVNIGTTPGGADIASNTYITVGMKTISIAPTAPSTIYITLATDQGQNGADASVYSVSMQASQGVLSVVAPWTAAQLPLVQAVAIPGSSQMVLVHPNVAPQVLSLSGSVWNLAPASFTAPPAEWTAAGGGNWPGAVCVYQSRLWLAGTPSQKNWIWASQVFNFFNFTLASGPGAPATVLASDAIVAKVSTRGAILWMHARQNLLVGTDLEELSVASFQGALTPMDMQVRPESGFGSAAQHSEDIGDQVLYVSRDRRKLRALNYLHQEHSWQSHDITFAGEHLTTPLIVEAHFARDPNYSVVLVLADGTMACCSYDRAAQAAAWWRFTTQGRILSASVSHGDSGSVLWLAVVRASGTFLERLPMAETDRVYVDSATTQLGTFASVTAYTEQIVVGADAYAGEPGIYNSLYQGKPVSCVINGVPVGGLAATTPQTIPTPWNNVIGIRFPIVLGLEFPTPTLITLPPEGGGMRGTSQRAKRKWVKAVLRVNNSAAPLVNGYRAGPLGTPVGPLQSVLVAPIPLYTDDLSVNPNQASGRGQLTITQDLPVRTEIVGLYGNVAVEEV